MPGTIDMRQGPGMAHYLWCRAVLANFNMLQTDSFNPAEMTSARQHIPLYLFMRTIVEKEPI
jgi:hypothetical protein